MQGMLPVKGAILLEFQFFLGIAPVFLGGIIPPLTFGALQGHQLHSGFFTGHILSLLLLCTMSCKTSAINQNNDPQHGECETFSQSLN
jgi:hypothetical protein